MPFPKEAFLRTKKQEPCPRSFGDVKERERSDSRQAKQPKELPQASLPLLESLEALGIPRVLIIPFLESLGIPWVPGSHRVHPEAC